MYKNGDRVIVIPYTGWEYKGIVVGTVSNQYQYSKSDTSFYYEVKEIEYGMISNVNPIKVHLDKEYYREQKLVELLSDTQK